MKKIHFIGVAGSAIAPIAIMMKNLGVEVTGSDEAVFEPSRSLLNKAGVDWYEGYDERRVMDVDLVIVGGGPLMKNPDNPEFIKALQLKKPIKGYAFLLKEYVVKEESIVIAGSYGKTTTSGMVNWILDQAGLDPSFMIGGKPANFPLGVRSTKSNYSCLEGDEFFSVYGFQNEPRFLYYDPKYTLISSAKWDHVNIYPTQDDYINSYKKLIDEVVKNNGKLYLCSSGENNKALEVHNQGRVEIVSYKVEEKVNYLDTSPVYYASDVKISEGLSQFEVLKEGESLGLFNLRMIGRHNIENALGAITITHDLGIDVKIIQSSIESFKGIKRRLEVVDKNPSGSIIVDDFAHSPVKAKATLSALEEAYPGKRIVAVYKPRFSSRENRKELDFYQGAFDKASEVIIPRIKVKKSIPKENRIYGKDIIEAINATQKNAHYIPRETDLIKKLKDLSNPETIIVFMSASGWEGVLSAVKKV